MKQILCYGDSNTYGFNPKSGSRFADDKRWTSLLATQLKGKCEIIEEGLNNRCGFMNNPEGVNYCALKHLPNVLTNDIDLLILAVGTNDLQAKYNIRVSTIEEGLKSLISTVKEKVHNIIIIPPVVLSENIFNGYFGNLFDRKSIEMSKKVFPVYKNVTKQYNCNFFDFNEFVFPSETDGVHYTEESHYKIATKLSEYILEEWDNFFKK